MDFVVAGLGLGALMVVVGFVVRDAGPLIRRGVETSDKAEVDQNRRSWVALCGGIAASLTAGGGFLVLVTLAAVLLDVSDGVGSIVVLTGSVIGIAGASILMMRAVQNYRAHSRVATLAAAMQRPVPESNLHQQELSAATADSLVVPAQSEHDRALPGSVTVESFDANRLLPEELERERFAADVVNVDADSADNVDETLTAENLTSESDEAGAAVSVDVQPDVGETSMPEQSTVDSEPEPGVEVVPETTKEVNQGHADHAVDGMTSVTTPQAPELSTSSETESELEDLATTMEPSPEFEEIVAKVEASQRRDSTEWIPTETDDPGEGAPDLKSKQPETLEAEDRINLEYDRSDHRPVGTPIFQSPLLADISLNAGCGLGDNQFSSRLLCDVDPGDLPESATYRSPLLADLGPELGGETNGSHTSEQITRPDHTTKEGAPTGFWKRKRAF